MTTQSSLARSTVAPTTTDKPRKHWTPTASVHFSPTDNSKRNSPTITINAGHTPHSTPSNFNRFDSLNDDDDADSDAEGKRQDVPPSRNDLDTYPNLPLAQQVPPYQPISEHHKISDTSNSAITRPPPSSPSKASTTEPPTTDSSTEDTPQVYTYTGEYTTDTGELLITEARTAINQLSANTLKKSEEVTKNLEKRIESIQRSAIRLKASIDANEPMKSSPPRWILSLRNTPAYSKVQTAVDAKYNEMLTVARDTLYSATLEEIATLNAELSAMRNTTINCFYTAFRHVLHKFTTSAPASANLYTEENWPDVMPSFIQTYNAKATLRQLEQQAKKQATLEQQAIRAKAADVERIKQAAAETALSNNPAPTVLDALKEHISSYMQQQLKALNITAPAVIKPAKRTATPAPPAVSNAKKTAKQTTAPTNPIIVQHAAGKPPADKRATTNSQKSKKAQTGQPKHTQPQAKAEQRPSHKGSSKPHNNKRQRSNSMPHNKPRDKPLPPQPDTEGYTTVQRRKQQRSNKAKQPQRAPNANAKPKAAAAGKHAQSGDGSTHQSA